MTEHKNGECVINKPLPHRKDQVEYYANIDNLVNDMDKKAWCDYCKEQFILGYYGRT